MKEDDFFGNHSTGYSLQRRKIMKKALFCRVPEEVHSLIHKQAAGPKSIGTFITKAVLDYVNRDTHLVKVVLEALEACSK
jgi:predicted HicB family RNase H-like nuclease